MICLLDVNIITRGLLYDVPTLLGVCWGEGGRCKKVRGHSQMTSVKFSGFKTHPVSIKFMQPPILWSDIAVAPPPLLT